MSGKHEKRVLLAALRAEGRVVRDGTPLKLLRALFEEPYQEQEGRGSAVGRTFASTFSAQGAGFLFHQPELPGYRTSYDPRVEVECSLFDITPGGVHAQGLSRRQRMGWRERY